MEMNQDERNVLRQEALEGPDDIAIQLDWHRRSLAEHLKMEQNTKCMFRLADFINDEQELRKAIDTLKAIRSAIGYLIKEIARLEQASQPI